MGAIFFGQVDFSKIHILVVDPDAKSAQSLCRSLSDIGYQVSLALHERDAFVLAEEKLFNLVLQAFDATKSNAVAVMEKIRDAAPDTQFIFVGDGGTIHTAVDAIRRGAFDYLSKPVKLVQLVESVRKALEHQALVAEDQRIKVRLRRQSNPNVFAGNSAVMQQVSTLVSEIAPTEVTVLIQGESGTGKEIVARAIHERSRRRSGPFVAVNCAALPDSIIETELFGHSRGAFTGAVSDRLGRFQLAQGGTLFLDEIGDLSPKGQADLLRVLEDGIFRPVGSPKTLRANVRIIAASNKDLEAMSMQGKFREDLLYRLNIVVVELPPLRERSEDIAPLVESFTKHFCAKHHRRPKRFSKETLSLFLTLPWPGNVRQLRNIVERLVVTVPGATVEPSDIPPKLLRTNKPEPAFNIRPGMTLAKLEAEMIRQTLLNITANRAEAARRLGISRRALQYKIKRYRLDTLPKKARPGAKRAEE